MKSRYAMEEGDWIGMRAHKNYVFICEWEKKTFATSGKFLLLAHIYT